MVRVMSIKLMTAVWEREDLASTHKLVLLALADWANDEGLCWPSINRLAVKASLTTRAVQKAIRALEQMGFVRREEVTGKGNRYWIAIPANHVHPCTTFIPPLNDIHPTPEPRSPNTSETHKLTTKFNIRAKPEGVSDQVWNDFLEVRKAKKAPLTATGLTRMANEAAKAGWTLEEAIAESVARGWQSFKAEWVKDRSNGQERNQHGRGKAKDGVNAALEDLIGFGTPARTADGHGTVSIEGSGQRTLAAPSRLR